MDLDHVDQIERHSQSSAEADQRVGLEWMNYITDYVMYIYNRRKNNQVIWAFMIIVIFRWKMRTKVQMNNIKI